MRPWLSIIIPCVGKPAETWFTLQGLLFDLPDGVEILVVDNEPLNATFTEDMVAKFGAPVRYLKDQAVQSPYHPRNAGAAHAEGEWLLFLDSHVLLQPNSLAQLNLNCKTEINGSPYYPPMSMVHFPVAFQNQKRWFGHYKMTLEQDFWGKWGPAPRGFTVDGKPYPIAASGIWAFLARKTDFAQVCGFNQEFRGYGGGEVYIHLKYWRLGGQVLMDPSIRGVHWSGPRGYPQRWQDRITNTGIGGRVVVGPDFIARFGTGLCAYYKKHGVNEMDASDWLVGGACLAAEAVWMEENAVLSFDEVLAKWEREGVLTG